MNPEPIQTIETAIVHLNTVASAIVISDNTQYKNAAVTLGDVKDRRKAVVDFFAEPKQKSHDAWKSIVAKEKFFTDRLDAIEKAIKSAMVKFQSEQERTRKELEDKLRHEAEEKARKEREKLLAQAKKAEANGNSGKAEELHERAETVMAAPVFVPSKVAPIAGVNTKKIWRVEVTDKNAFIETALKNQMLLNLIEIDESALLKVRSLCANIPGIRFFQEDSISVKSTH